MHVVIFLTPHYCIHPCNETVRQTQYAFHKMFSYDATSLGLTAICKDRGNTVGRLQDRHILQNKLKIKYV
jgi:hypothetical protein